MLGPARSKASRTPNFLPHKKPRMRSFIEAELDEDEVDIEEMIPGADYDLELGPREA